MPKSCTNVYVHYVWATWDRAPLLSAGLEPRLFSCLSEKCREMGCQLLMAGGTEDHLHVLARLHASVSVADLAKNMKGASSHLVTRVLRPASAFRWQGSYGAFTVSPERLAVVTRAIQRQKEHHRGSVIGVWERCVESEPTNESGAASL